MKHKSLYFSLIIELALFLPLHVKHFWAGNLHFTFQLHPFTLYISPSLFTNENASFLLFFFFFGGGCLKL